MDNIVLIDSGLGGLSALRDLYNKIPNFNYVYFADTKNLPYGTKTRKELLKLTVENITKIKEEYNPNIIIFGCNTLGTTIFVEIQKIFPTIKFFALQPNLKCALKNNKKRILVLGTTQTINRLRNQKVYLENKNYIILCKMPKLATKVEIYIQKPANIVPYLKQRLGKLKEIDCIVLGCSHYYFVKEQLKFLFKSAKIIDGTKILSKEVLNYIKSKNLIDEVQKSNIKLILTSNVSNKSAYNRIIENILKSKKSW